MPEVLSTRALEHAALERVAPNILSAAHWGRIQDGALYATSARVDWATLLARTFHCDVRVCVRCGGRLVVRALVTDRETARRFLESLRRPRAPPHAAA